MIIGFVGTADIQPPACKGLSARGRNHAQYTHVKANLANVMSGVRFRCIFHIMGNAGDLYNQQYEALPCNFLKPS